MEENEPEGTEKVNITKTKCPGSRQSIQNCILTYEDVKTQELALKREVVIALGSQERCY